ncbi:hypothetical protein EVAR_40945_1 [Eumeta japonica]|uniref:Uncharacterized protein n=1 Tax=Eumeta variegata TaxID=151549 RepID=A0A4C1X3R3_EUMVA|nr:hypothetical protein EVAR_40945_1 [Eumeta japonica]
MNVRPRSKLGVSTSEDASPPLRPPCTAHVLKRATTSAFTDLAQYRPKAGEGGICISTSIGIESETGIRIMMGVDHR